MRRLAVNAIETVNDCVLARAGYLEYDSVPLRAAARRGPVEIPVAAFDHGSNWIVCVEILHIEAVQDGMDALRSELEYGSAAVLLAAARGATGVSRPIEIAIRRLNQRINRGRAVGAIKRKQRRFVPRGSHLVYCATVSVEISRPRSVEITVACLNRGSGGICVKALSTEIVKRSQVALRRNLERRTVASATIPTSAVECRPVEVPVGAQSEAAGTIRRLSCCITVASPFGVILNTTPSL